MVEEDDTVQTSNSYCWQHKDQAEARPVGGKRASSQTHRPQNGSTELFTLKEQRSIDTLVQKLGIDARSKHGGQARSKSKNPNPNHNSSVVDFAAQPSAVGKYSSKPHSRKQQGFWSSLCCISGGDDDDYLEIVRHRKRVERNQSGIRPTEPTPLAATHAGHDGRSPGRASVPHWHKSETSHPQTSVLLSLIPPQLSPQVTSSLLAELLRPISPHDEEGYIYIFWLTPQSKRRPQSSTAHSLIAGDSRASGSISDAMTEFSVEPASATKAKERKPGEKRKRTIMLKIGRASNVTRRMNEWSRQCGFALNLVRWYPHVPSSETPTTSTHAASHMSRQSPGGASPLSHTSSGGNVRKVPHVKRVERLIHLELSTQQVMKQCEACMKEHREWFEVEASQNGVARVDQTIKRWVSWAETQSGEPP